LDLEDSVALSEKDAAQFLVRNALRSVDFYGVERMVRINQLPRGVEDLKFIVPHNVHVILIPKCESAEQVLQIEENTVQIAEKHNLKNEIFYMPIIESALGALKAFEIASSSKNICALAVGLEDYTADIGVQRTNEGKESFFARSMIVNAAKAAGVQAIDTVFSDVEDMDGLRLSVLEAKALGFEGKGCIHPRQIKVVHEAFAPTQEEIQKAQKIVEAFKEAEKQFVKVLKLDPNNAVAWNNYGNALRELNKLEEGEKIMRDLVESSTAPNYLKELARTELSFIKIKNKTI
jgi:citrate lyase subunit beta/citryl-CoA lyase